MTAATVRNQTFKTSRFLIAITLIAIFSGPAHGQTCMEYSPPDNVFDTSAAGCKVNPTIDRAFFPEVIQWGGQEILVMSRGNELGFYDLKNPLVPSPLGTTSFRVGNQGDSDHDLLSYLACDDCRYGVAFYKLATVFFDLGSGAAPSPDAFTKDSSLTSLSGGMTFKHGASQYLIAPALQNACSSGSGLYILDSTEPDSLPHLQCLSKANGTPVGVAGGLLLQHEDYNDGKTFIWGSDSYNTHIFEVTGSGEDLRLEHVRVIGGMNTWARGNSILGFAVDLDQGLAVSMFRGTMKTWSIKDLSNPQQIGSLQGNAENMIEMSYPVVWAGQYAYIGSSTTFEVSNPENPQALHPEYWSETKSWNQLVCSTVSGDLGAAFTGDGEYLFLARWEVMQRHDFSECTMPQAPTSTLVASGEFNGHTYEVRSAGDSMAWHSAKDDCTSRGGYLATIQSQDENQFIADLMTQGSDQSTYCGTPTTMTWIGFTDENSEGDWNWVTGEPVDYTNWNSGAPDNEDGNEHYAHLYCPESSGFPYWNDDNADNPQATAYVCERSNEGCAGPYYYWTEIATHNEGYGNSVWRTDVVARNTSAVTANIEFNLHTESDLFSLPGNIVADGQGVFEDIVGTIGIEDQGALEICSDQPLKIVSRIYNLAQDGTKGQFFDGQDPSNGLSQGEMVELLGLRQKSGEYRTNITVTNTGQDPSTVQIRLFGTDGTELHAYTLAVGAGKVVLDSQPFNLRAGQPDLGWGYASVEVLNGNGVFSSASVVDSRTNDATTIPMKR